MTLASRDGPGTYCGNHPRRVRVRVGVDDGGRVEAADQLGGLDLAPEPLPELRVAGQLGADQLDGHQPAARRFPQVDDPHPADGKPFDQTVRSNMARITVLQRCHRAPCHPP